MKKYVAPMSCVLSMKMDENIAYSEWVSVNEKYAIVNGKISNTPFKYTAKPGYANDIYYSIGQWLIGKPSDVDKMGQYLIDMSTTCYIGEGDPEQIVWPLG